MSSWRFALRVTFALVAFGLAPGATASAVCTDNPLQGIERPPRDQSPCGSLGATLLAVGAAFFEDCSPDNPAMVQKYSEIAARYAGMPPNVGLPAMAAELSAEVVAPAAPGPVRLSFGGLVIEALYERGTDDRGVPIDLYFYRNRAIPGAPVPQGEQEWNRFVRVPAAGSSSTEPGVWWHARWTYGAGGWVSVGERGITPPQAVP